MKKRKQLSLGQKALRALKEAVREVVEDHRRRGIPLAVWRNGRAVLISAEEADGLPAARSRKLKHRRLKAKS
jgi:hypothetical protein